MNKHLLFVALATALAATSVQAADSGFYLGGSVGQAKLDNLSGSDLDRELARNGYTSTTNLDDSDTGWKLFAGYRFMKNFALEGAYTNFGTFSARSAITAPSAGVVNTDVDLEAWTVSAVGILPIGDHFSVFGRLGVNVWNVDVSATGTGSGGTARAAVSEDGTNVVYGLGAAYAVSKNLGVRAEWERYDFDGTDVDLLSAGVSFSF